MPNVHAVLGVIAGLVTVAGFVPYIRSIIRHKTKPHRATYGIWTAVGLVTITGYIAGGASTTIWVGLVYTLLTAAVFLLSLTYGVGGLSKLDIICLIGAALGIVLWVTTNNPQTALYTGIVIEAIGTIPTWRKAYSHPETEDTLAWAIDGVGSLINLFALTSFSLHIALYPLWSFLGGATVTALLLRPRLRRYVSS
ncbi:MAG: hypothetical protein JWN38_493 [Candidatus Saccharibacteria bacterium]|nr:hypothetical protein [Candidatus Saccharibacteria bacterium]